MKKKQDKMIEEDHSNWVWDIKKVEDERKKYMKFKRKRQ